MITAKDVHRKKFEKVKFGYSPEEVDSFMAALGADMRLMEQELAESGDKIQLLADKVREYKETEDDLRNALIGAQKQAREVVEAAHEKAAQIEAEARANVGNVQQQALADQEEQLAAISKRLAEENAVLVATQKQVAAFKQALFDMYKAHLEQISQLPDSADAYAPAPAKAEEQPAGDKPAEDKPADEKPAEEKAAESAVTEEADAEAPKAEQVEPAGELPAETEAAAAEEKKETEAEAVTADPFVQKKKSEHFGSRRDEKRRRS